MSRILPVFIPFYGCKSRCIYCNQHAITGLTAEKAEESVRKQIETWLGRNNEYTEIAFYGGSFAFLPKTMRERLYALAREYVDCPIRVSTCPDSINPDFIQEAKDFSIATVELGIQSLSDKVLIANGRAYSAEEALGVIASLKQNVKISAQFMTGMYAEERADLILTAKKAERTGADLARIYPTAVFENTELYKAYQRSEYTPPSPEESLLRTAWLYICLEAAGIKVIRVGLPPEAEGIVAGYVHPAFGDILRTLLVASYAHIYGALPEFIASGYKSFLRHNLSLPKTNAVDTMHLLCVAIKERIGAGDKWFAEKQIAGYASALVL